MFSNQSVKSHVQIELEEEKVREITKLQHSMQQEKTNFQHSMQAMQNKLEGKNAFLVKEHGAAQKEIEKSPPIIQETPVILQETEKIETLTVEVENLKVMLINSINVTKSFSVMSPALNIITSSNALSFFYTLHLKYLMKLFC